MVRIQKFGPGGVFGKHTDQPVRRADGRNSKYSLRIFLNGKEARAREGGGWVAGGWLDVAGDLGKDGEMGEGHGNWTERDVESSSVQRQFRLFQIFTPHPNSQLTSVAA